MGAFIQHVGLDIRSVKQIRAPTGRKELRYHNVGCRDSLAVHALVQNLVLESYKAGVVQADSRVIVFCSTVNDAKATSEALGCLQYHGKMDQQERNSIQRTWMEGASPASRCIAATSAFVHGIDAPFVDLIVFLNPPYGAIDFVQASARGGRRGRPAMVVLVHHGSVLSIEKPDYAMHATMNAYVANQVRCRRSILSEAMDGFSAKCDAFEGDQLCDICQSDSKMIQLVKKTANMHTMPEQKCLTLLRDEQQDEKTEEDEDAHMYEGFDDSEIAAIEMPNSLEVQQVCVSILCIVTLLT